MIRLIAVAEFAVAVATRCRPCLSLSPSAGQHDHVREACGPGRVRINGVCVARTTTRQVAEESVGVRAGVEALALSGTETPSNGAVFRRRAKWTTYCRTWCSGSARSSSC